MENIKPYNKYKPSGIAWLGDIPAHWERWKISRGVKNIGSGTTPSSGNKDFYENGTINWLNTGDFNNGILFKCKKKVTSKALQENSSLKLFPKGTLSIAMYGATIGKVCIIQFDATTNQACCNIVEGKIFDNKFLMYWFIGHKPHIVNLSYGGGQPNISQDVIKSLFVPCPIKSEQTAIANFLDYKTAKIDRFIRKKKQLIKLLNEQKAGIINHAVTKGLDPIATMKDSGIEWLGEIPEHWIVRKIGRSIKGIGSGTTPLSSNTHFYENGTINWINSGDLNDNLVYECKKQITQKAFNETSSLKKFPKGTLTVAMYGATIGKVGLLQIEATTNQACCNIPINSFYDTKFLMYWFMGNRKHIINLSYGGGQPNISQDTIKSLHIPCTSIEEQQAIVEHIEKETSKLITTIQTMKKK